jgi:streptogramin lyase
MNRVFLLLLCVTETLGCSSPGTDLTCGVGTVQAGDQCVAASREGGASQDAGPRDAKTVDGTSGDATSDCHHCIVAEYAVPAKLGTPTPDQLVFDAEKNLWFADGDELVRMTPGGVFTGFPIADADASGLGVNAFTVGADGALWFTENEGGFANRTVGRMTLGGSVTRFATTATAGFDEIALGPDGDFWLTENAAIAPGAPGVVARFTPAGTLTEFTLPGPRYPTGITAGPNGDVYFCEQAVYMGPGNSIGRITPSTGDLTEYAIAQVDAGGESQAFGIVTGADGNLWGSSA